MENLLLKKLQIKPGFKVAVVNAPENFNAILGDLPSDLTFLFDASANYQALLLFAITKGDLVDALQQEYQKINNQTIVWIIYPKAKTKLASDLNLMQSWEDLKQFNLAPCASAAIDTIWTSIRIKPLEAQKKSGVGNTEIKQNEYGSYIDTVNKIVTLPEDLKAALTLNETAFNYYKSLAYSHRKEYVLWILTAKQEKTRTDRIQKMVEKLLSKKKNPSEK
ncbi:YdeI/OmpD-associated family protein [Pedobacter sp. Du54]|uniref:YdeI/OmpD-associated family protein n=1 Tax=Pedobacter anseongensis TaxID=3133439 RepID=UPI003096B6B9